MIISAIAPKFFNTQPKPALNNNWQNTKETPLYSSLPSFKASTSAGNPLKKLKDIICPYFGVKMITGAELPRIEAKINECVDVEDIIKTLSPYKKYLQKVEKKMFKTFEAYAKFNPNTNLQSILKKEYNQALIKLKLEEFKVLDNVDKISLKLSPELALQVHGKTTKCRQIILENNPKNVFKRKILLDSLEELKPKRAEKKVYEELKDRAEYLPTSATSENAFIVKYANRTQEEIAKRLIRVSMATIEHVKPNSKNGQNEISNFMLTSANANNMRSNMPLSKFISMFPNIPKNCQKYIEQIISILKNGGLKGNETYPFKIKKTLFKESQGKIDLDLSSYDCNEKQALERTKKYWENYRRKR